MKRNNPTFSKPVQANSGQQKKCKLSITVNKFGVGIIKTFSSFHLNLTSTTRRFVFVQTLGNLNRPCWPCSIFPLLACSTKMSSIYARHAQQPKLLFRNFSQLALAPLVGNGIFQLLSLSILIWSNMILDSSILLLSSYSILAFNGQKTWHFVEPPLNLIGTLLSHGIHVILTYFIQCALISYIVTFSPLKSFSQ